MNNYFNHLGKVAPIFVFDDPNGNGGPLPPIYIDPIKYPWDPIKEDPKDNGDGGIKPPIFRAYYYSGVVRSSSEQPLPGATVALIKNGVPVATRAADRNGEFAIDISEPVDYITITHATHKPFTWPASEVQHTFDLEPNEVVMPPVFLPPGGNKNNTLLLLLGALAVAKWQKWI